MVDGEGAIAHSRPGRIKLQAPRITSENGVDVRRDVVMRWIGADYLHTPDIELFGLDPKFDRIDVYPSRARREDFFYVNAPAVVYPVGEPAWFREDLYAPERELFDHAEIYIREVLK